MSSQEYPVHVGSAQVSILGPTIFLLYINNPSDDVICDIAIYADDTTLYSNCDRHLICRVGFNWLLNWNLWDTGVGHEVSCWFQCLKNSTVFLFFFNGSNNTDVIDIRMDWFILEEKSSFKMPGLIFSSKLDWGCYIISIARTTSKKIEALIRSMKFLSPEAVLHL